MLPCKLCRQREANQTGSHILSWFLIRDAINNKGKRRRHNEISFEISSATFVNTYFGNEVLPPEIERIRGRELSDQEIEELAGQKNPYTEDNIFCSHCEDRFGTLETYISREIFERLRKYKVNPLAKYEILEFSQKEAVRLFIYSLAWRASITKFSHFEIDPFYEEMLRRILDSSLDVDEPAFLTKAIGNSKKICELPLIIAFLETIGENTNSIYCFRTNRPYSIIANDLVFQLFFKEKHTKQIQESLFGVNRILHKQKVLNLNEERIKIAAVNDIERKKIYSNIYAFIADKIMRSGVSMFRYAFQQIFKTACPSGLAEYYKHRVAFGLAEQVQLYSPEHFRNVALDVMQEYFVANQVAIFRRFQLANMRWFL